MQFWNRRRQGRRLIIHKPSEVFLTPSVVEYGRSLFEEPSDEDLGVPVIDPPPEDGLRVQDTSPADLSRRGAGSTEGVNILQQASDLTFHHHATIGLLDDDHTLYLNAARGDARYFTQTQLRPTAGASVLDVGQANGRYYPSTTYVIHSVGAGNAGDPVLLNELGRLHGTLIAYQTSGTPDANDDNTGSPYEWFVGALWVDTAGDNAYISVDASDGAAIWKRITTTGAGGDQLSDLTDVGVTTPTDGNVLRADGDSWESAALVEADISDFGTYIKADGTVPLTDDWNAGSKKITVKGAIVGGGVRHCLYLGDPASSDDPMVQFQNISGTCQLYYQDGVVGSHPADTLALYAGHFTLNTNGRVYFRDNALSIYSSRDGELNIAADTKVSILNLDLSAIIHAGTLPAANIGAETVSLAKVAADAKTYTYTFYIPYPMAGVDIPFAQIPKDASITRLGFEVLCESAAAGTCEFNIAVRGEASPYAGGTDLYAADVEADETYETDGQGDWAAYDIEPREWLAVTVSTSANKPTALVGAVEVEFD